MNAEHPEAWSVLWRDIESLSTPEEFTERVCDLINPLLAKSDQAKSRMLKVLAAVGGTELAGAIKLPNIQKGHWKTLLENAFECLEESQEGQVLFVWDELPYMLHNIQKRVGPEAAMDVLDMLRHIRQTHGRRFPMMFCGSIGMHHVVRSLRGSGHSNPSINDLFTVELPPLAHEAAAELGERLIVGEGLICERPKELAEHVANLVDHVPFYIHSVIQQLSTASGSVTNAAVDEVLSRALVDATDPWHLRHYEIRLRDYYGGQDAAVAKALLDEIASASGPVSARELHHRLASHTTTIGDVDETRDLLQRLAQDHYLIRHTEDGRYSFRFSVIRRWWRIAREIA